MILSDALRTRLGRIQKDLPSLSLEIALIEDPALRYDYARSQIVSHYQTKVSNHGRSAVDATIEAIATPDMTSKRFWDRTESNDRWGHLLPALRTRIQRDRSARAKRTSTAAREFPTRMTPATLLDYWTQRRHSIVHTGTTVSVWREEAVSCSELVALLGEELDRLAHESA